MLSVTCLFKFEAAHRLIHHPGRCRYLHGHSYRVEVEVGLVKTELHPDGTPDLGKHGMVVDFADVKREVGGWIDQNWDHNTILNSNDPALWVNGDPLNPGTPEDPRVMTQRFGRVPFIFPGLEPTAERMAIFLIEKDWEFQRNDYRRTTVAQIVQVRVWETDSCSATVQG